jgi:predicted RNA-binding Zn-ribbon protein involved in translation (DUF1610 family)
MTTALNQMSQMYPTERAVPFYCPYCGEEDIEPQ